MDYSLLVQDKKLIPTIPCTIYQGENNADRFKILVPKEYESTLPALQVILPDNTGKIKQCQFDACSYKDNWLVIYIPIISVLTLTAGEIQMWLTFFQTEGEEKTFKTGCCCIDIVEHKGLADPSVDGGFEDIGETVLKLKTEVKSLHENKADSIILDSKNKTLSLKSGEKEIASVSLPDDVVWEVME